jgi:DNA-binding response OmpR family regulator
MRLTLNPAPATGPHTTVLVVDDEPVLRSLLTRVLAGAGYAVLEAEHGEHALVQARRSKTPLSLVITDINMPVMDGIELARALRPHHPRTPILFITGRGSESDSSTRVEAWGELLRKPFKPDTLLERVAMILTRAAEGRRTSA